MDRIFEHVVNKIGTGSNEIIESLQDLQVLSLLFVEDVEPVLVLIELHLVHRLLQLVSLLLDHFFSFFDLFLFVLQLLDLFVYLLLHHLEQVLVLDLKLVHDSAERLLQLVHLFVELLPDLHLQLVVKIFIDCNALVMFVDLDDHFFDHLFHLLDFGGDLDDIVLHLRVLQNTLGAEHGSVIFTIELDLFGWMDLAVPDRVCRLILSIGFPFLRVRVLHSHGQGREYLVVYRKVFGRLVVRDLIVGAFDHLVLV